MRQFFDEMYPQCFCQVIDNYDPRAEQIIDDFKGDGANNELTIAISVDMLDTGIDIPRGYRCDASAGDRASDTTAQYTWP